MQPIIDRGRCTAGENQPRLCCLLPRAAGPAMSLKSITKCRNGCIDLILKSPAGLGLITSSVWGRGRHSRIEFCTPPIVRAVFLPVFFLRDFSRTAFRLLPEIQTKWDGCIKVRYGAKHVVSVGIMNAITGTHPPARVVGITNQPGAKSSTL